MKKLSPPLEREIQKACLHFLQMKGSFAWRNNTVGVYNAKADSYRFHGLRGVSDIIGIYKGKFLACEIKRPGNNPTPEQLKFLREVNARGGIGICVHSLDELEKELRLEDELTKELSERNSVSLSSF